MKKFTLLIALALFSTLSHAAIKGAPFQPEIDARFDAVEGNSTVQASNGLHQKQIAVATWDFSKHGGSSTAAIDLGVTLPAGAIIDRSFIRLETKPTGSGSPTLAFKCEDANNIFSATSLASYHDGDMIEGAATGASTAFGHIDANCNISAVIGTNDFSAGKVSAFIEYFVHP